MKRILALAALALVAGLVIWIQLDDVPQQVEVKDLPWQIETLPDGRSRVFGVTLGDSTLQQVSEYFEALPEVGAFVDADDTTRIEAYFGRVRLGVLEARVIAQVGGDPAVVQQYIERSPLQKPMPSGARKYELLEADLSAVYQWPVVALTYVPSAQYQTDIVEQRFGVPAEVVELDALRRYWLYPNLGLAMLISDEEKEILEYVAPRDFDALRARVVASAQAAAASE